MRRILLLLCAFACAANALTDDERATIALFERASPAVVYITSLSVRRDFFTMNVLQIPQGTGSGFVWDNAGHVVTNFHVIQNADSAQVTLSDRTTWTARLVGVAPAKDLAVLRIDAPASKLHALPVGSSEDLRVGQSVLAIVADLRLQRGCERSVRPHRLGHEEDPGDRQLEPSHMDDRW